MDLRGADNLSSTAPLGDKTPVSTDRPDAGGVPVKISTCVMNYDLASLLEDFSWFSWFFMVKKRGLNPLRAIDDS